MSNLYQNNIKKYYDRSISDQGSTKTDSDITLMDTFDSLNFSLGFDSKAHTLVSLCITQKNASNEDLGIFYSMKSLLVGLPIIEVFEHGMLIIENKLRDDFSHRPVDGIVQIENTLEIFVPLQYGLRNIITQYSKKVPSFVFANHYEIPISEEWKISNTALQTQKIEELAQIFLSKQQKESRVSLTLLSPKRVEIDFVDISKNELPQLLFNFERFLSTELSFRMEVMYAEKQDINKKRQ